MMKLKLDVKTLVVGMALGVALAAVIGGTGRPRPETTLVGSADVSRFGMAIAERGFGLVRTDDGLLYVVNPKEGMAVRVLTARTPGVDPEDPRDARGRSFNLSGLIQGGKEPEEY